ncbi:hypothetical protein GOE04_11495 [Sinorhizobium medicae]|nr:hypothetical protein [Sinorhizobium medicae]MDX0940324.1 hypothetical protein [Sinorhizobium medicae]
MSSREIADVTGKRHPDVKRDIERMLVDLEEDVSRFAHIYIDSMNREQTEYRLDRELTETLLLGYSAPLRRKVIKRLRELEAMVASPRPLITTETLIQMLTLQAEVERRQAEQAKAITAIDARVERVETAQTVLSARPANSESIVHIRRRIWRLYGLSDATVDAVMRQSPYAPKPAGMVRNNTPRRTVRPMPFTGRKTSPRRSNASLLSADTPPANSTPIPTSKAGSS